MTQRTFFDHSSLSPPASPPAIAAAPRSDVDQAPRRCTRCKGTRFRDFPIHKGRSVRRDCAHCGRTLGFPVWYGQAKDVNGRGQGASGGAT